MVLNSVMPSSLRLRCPYVQVFLKQPYKSAFGTLRGAPLKHGFHRPMPSGNQTSILIKPVDKRDRTSRNTGCESMHSQRCCNAPSNVPFFKNKKLSLLVCDMPIMLPATNAARPPAPA